MIECRHGQVIISVFSWDLLAALSLRGFVASSLRAYFSSCLRGSVASWLVLP